MCHPMIAAAVVGGLQIAQGFAQNQAAKQQARNYELEGRQALAAGSAEANLERAKTSRELGQVRAIQSASGVDLSSGSAADVGGRVAALGEQEALMKLYGGRLGNWRAKYAAQVAKQEGKSALLGSVVSAGSTLLGSGISSGFFKK